MILVNFDVLALSGDEFVKRLPRNEGIALWHALYAAHSGMMHTIVDDNVDVEVVEHWLKTYMIKDLETTVLGVKSPFIKWDRLRHIAKPGDLYVDVDPTTIANMMRSGTTSLLLADPYVVRPEWEEPKRLPRSWDDIAEEVDRQNMKRAEKLWKEVDQ